MFRYDIKQKPYAVLCGKINKSVLSIQEILRTFYLIVPATLLSFIFSTPLNADTGREVYLINIGWHVGIAVPLNNEVRKHILAPMDFPNAQFLEIGWGSKEYYQAKDPSIAIALKVATTPGPAVLHLYAFSRSIEETFPNADILKVLIGQADFKNLLNYMKSSFISKNDGKHQILASGLYGPESSRFYAATGTFHLFNTCNRWTSGAVEKMGIHLKNKNIITAGMLMDEVRKTLETRR